MNLKQKDPVQTGGIVWSSSLGNACNFEVKKKKKSCANCELSGPQIWETLLSFEAKKSFADCASLGNACEF